MLCWKAYLLLSYAMFKQLPQDAQHGIPKTKSYLKLLPGRRRHRDTSVQNGVVITITRYRDVAKSRYRDIPISGYRVIAISRYRDITITQYRDIAASRYREIVISRYRDIALSWYRDDVSQVLPVRSVLNWCVPVSPDLPGSNFR